ncbi:6873_t:CDS:2, partial [Gigaspora margarita]
YWQEPCIVSCGSELVTTNGKKPKNVPVNAIKVDKYALLESGKIIQIDQWLPLILVVNVAGINITDEGLFLESKDLPEEISFPEDVHIKQRYHLMGASFCDGNHHVADVRFENVKNAGWYQYDGLGKTYRARAMFIENSRPPHKNGYAMDFAIY